MSQDDERGAEGDSATASRPQPQPPGAAVCDATAAGVTPATASAGNMVRLRGGDFFGLEGRMVEVQVDVSTRGQPAVTIVGLAGKSIRESRERIWAGIKNSGFSFPFKKRILINLAPTAQHKDGAGFDLAIAVGILLADRQVAPGDGWMSPPGLLSCVGVIGELGLEGELRAVPGALLVADGLVRAGVRLMIVPQENAAEVRLVRDIEVVAASRLREVLDLVSQPLEAVLRQARSGDGERQLAAAPADPSVDFEEVRGQEATKRALLIASAGVHNVLLCGPPGAGKTMLARRLPSIQPPPGYEEALEMTRIQSACGGVACSALVSERPFRSPHHTISYAGLVGGGSLPQPGEVSRAHGGVLFLDEFAEFSRRSLESLREPLEEGMIRIGRCSGCVTFPARFLLVAAMNPCPCGYYGSERRDCSCSRQAVVRYAQRISGPLLDRFDLFVGVRPVDPGALLSSGRSGLSTSAMRDVVARARKIQERRWGGGVVNGRVPFPRLLKRGGATSSALETLAAAATQWQLSARGYSRALRVARTVADLAGRDELLPEDVHEAFHFREWRGARQS